MEGAIYLHAPQRRRILHSETLTTCYANSQPLLFITKNLVPSDCYQNWLPLVQYFHSDPVLKLRARSEPLGNMSNDSSEDLCIIYPKAIARIDVHDLQVSCFRIFKFHVFVIILQ